MKGNGNNIKEINGVLVLEHYNIYGEISGTSTLDIIDKKFLGNWTWSLNNGYVIRRKYPKRTIFLHRELMDAAPGTEVDHINRIRTDNTRKNLRVVTGVENRRNKSIYCTSSTGIAGVHYRPKINKYDVYLIIDGVKRYIGRFDNINEASKARLSFISNNL